MEFFFFTFLEITSIINFSLFLLINLFIFFASSNEGNNGSFLPVILTGFGIACFIVACYVDYKYNVEKFHNSITPLQWYIEFRYLFEFLYPHYIEQGDLLNYDLTYNAISHIEKLQNKLNYFNTSQEQWLIEKINNRYNLRLKDLVDLYDLLQFEIEKLANPPPNMPPHN